MSEPVPGIDFQLEPLTIGVCGTTREGTGVDGGSETRSAAHGDDGCGPLYRGKNASQDTCFVLPIAQHLR